MNCRDPLEAVDVTAIICGSKKKKCASEEEGLECEPRGSCRWGSRWWIFHVLWFRLYAPDAWVIPGWRGRAASVSLSSHSVSGNDAELRAVLQEHVPCAEETRHRVRDHCLMGGFAADVAAKTAHQSPAGSGRAAGTSFYGSKGIKGFAHVSSLTCFVPLR